MSGATTCEVRAMEEDHDDSSDGVTDPDGCGDHVPSKGDVTLRSLKFP